MILAVSEAVVVADALVTAELDAVDECAELLATAELDAPVELDAAACDPWPVVTDCPHALSEPTVSTTATSTALRKNARAFKHSPGGSVGRGGPGNRQNVSHCAHLG